MPTATFRSTARPFDVASVWYAVYSSRTKDRVMDKVEGWNGEEWVGSKFAACMWIYTEAVLCDGRGRPPQDVWVGHVRISCGNMSG